MSKYPSEIVNTLIKGGWFENRAIDASSIKRFVISEGFAWFPQVENFLKEFSGLYFTCSTSDGVITDFRFDVVLSIESFDTYWILDYYTSRIPKKTSFCPIGVLGGSHMQLFMDEDGYFYGGYDDILLCFGKGVVEFIQNLCSGNREYMIS